VIVMPSGLSTASRAECRALAAAFSMYPSDVSSSIPGFNQTSREHSGALGRCEQRDGFPVVLVGRALGAGSLDASGRVQERSQMTSAAAVVVPR
jgi:hypothetical protein